MIDGGGQTITCKYKGYFTNLVKQIEFKIKEECEHFNGYCKYISEYTVQINCSPFNFDELKMIEIFHYIIW